MKILIADDDPVIRKLLETSLKKWGYEVVSAADGNEALLLLQEPDAPHFMLLDWMMPGTHGIDICRTIRQRDNETISYIILITARGSKEDVVSGFEAGADDFISKPFDTDELRARIKAGQRILELQSDLANRVKELEEALAHIKTLQGILPICMHCHKIRDDKEIWQKLEEYIIENTDVMLSHSVCPACLEKHYPHYADLKDPTRNS